MLGPAGPDGPAWEADALVGASAAGLLCFFFSLFRFSSDKKQKENQRGIREDLERCDKILKVLNLRSIQ